MKHKLKHFMWKCLKNCLPVNKVLNRRTGKREKCCYRRGEGVETLEHMLCDCEYAKRIRKLATRHGEGLNDLKFNFGIWRVGLLRAKERPDGKDHLDLTINTLWQIWKDRNRVTHGQQAREELSCVQKAQQEWLEFKEAEEVNDRKCIAETTHQHQNRNWCPPEQGIIRINTDAAIAL